MDSSTLTLFSGNAHPALAREIARHLGMPLGRISVGRFSDGEISVEIMEHIRGHDVVIVQPTSPPTNDNLMELLVMDSDLDELVARRATAKELRAAAIAKGFRSLSDEGLQRAIDGTTSLTEVAREIDLTGRYR